jgi:hypothetical protein
MIRRARCLLSGKQKIMSTHFMIGQYHTWLVVVELSGASCCGKCEDKQTTHHKKVCRGLNCESRPKQANKISGRILNFSSFVDTRYLCTEVITAH